MSNTANTNTFNPTRGLRVRDIENGSEWVVTNKRGDMIWLTSAAKFDNKQRGANGLHRKFWGRLEIAA